MNCEIFEQEIIQVLEEKDLCAEVKEHIKECSSCAGFYKYILYLKQEFKSLERLQPSFGLELKIIERLKGSPFYFKVFIFGNAISIFLCILLIPFIFKKYFPKIIILSSEIFKIFGVLYKTYSFNFYPFLILFFLTGTFFLLLFAFLDLFLLSRIITEKIEYEKS